MTKNKLKEWFSPASILIGVGLIISSFWGLNAALLMSGIIWVVVGAVAYVLGA